LKIDKVVDEGILARKTMKEQAELKREKEVERIKKENVDENLLHLQALDTAQSCYSSLSYDKVRVCSETSKKDAAGALFNKFFQQKAVNE